MFFDTNHAPQQGHDTLRYAGQRIIQILAFSFSISIILRKHLDAGKN